MILCSASPGFSFHTFQSCWVEDVGTKPCSVWMRVWVPLLSPHSITWTNTGCISPGDVCQIWVPQLFENWCTYLGVHFGALNVFRNGAMENCWVEATAAILLSHRIVYVVYLLNHDNTENGKFAPTFWWRRITMIQYTMS